MHTPVHRKYAAFSGARAAQTETTKVVSYKIDCGNHKSEDGLYNKGLYARHPRRLFPCDLIDRKPRSQLEKEKAKPYYPDNQGDSPLCSLYIYADIYARKTYTGFNYGQHRVALLERRSEI